MFSFVGKTVSLTKSFLTPTHQQRLHHIIPPQVEKLWEHAFQARLRAVASERPVLVAEASWSTAKERRGLMELMFEKFGVPAMFPAKNAMLSAFSTGRATALVSTGTRTRHKICTCGPKNSLLSQGPDRRARTGLRGSEHQHLPPPKQFARR